VNCDQFAKVLTAGTPLEAEEIEHMRSCPACSQLAMISARMQGPAIDPAVENRIIDALTSGLTPVATLAPAWWYVVATLAGLVMVAVAGILMLGRAGWTADSILQRAFFTACLGGGMLASACSIAQLMTPGTFVILPPARTIAVGLACAGAGAFLYPAISYEGFVRAIAVCNSIGLALAVIASTLTFIAVRRGAMVRRLEMVSMVAFAGGLTGIAVLYVFCPHRDFWHFLLGHTPVLLTAVAIGASLARKVDLTWP
jgi:hypothetical protein